MRALLDANLYISYLLSPDANTPPILLVDAAFGGAYILLITNGVIAELRKKTATKPYLVARIKESQANQLVEELGSIAQSVPRIEEPFPEVGRDRKDDYLFAHALVGRADFLISGDLGVQGIGRIGEVQILRPAEFLQVLRQSGRLPGEPRQPYP